MSTFECKDCGVIFQNAELFVYHVDTCVPRKPGLTPDEVTEIYETLELFTTHLEINTPSNDTPGEWLKRLRRARKLQKRVHETL